MKKTNLPPQSSELEKSLSIFQAVLESTADGILVVDQTGRLLVYNEKFRHMWKIPTKIMHEQLKEDIDRFMMKHLTDPSDYCRRLVELYQAPQEESCDEIHFTDGRVFERYSIPHIHHQHVIGRVFNFRDVTRQRQLEQQLIRQATHDTLTELPNRALLDDRLSQAIQRARRNNTKVALLFLDVDRFKLINDSYGHNVGDLLLQSLSKRLKRVIRQSDTIARWGGDEFVIMMPDVHLKEDVVHVIERILKVLEEPYCFAETVLSSHVSVGISLYPDDGADVTTLLKNADCAMYHAKSEQKNQWSFYIHEMNNRARDMLELEQDLKKAITGKDLSKNRGELFLSYQPVIDVPTNQIVSVECLARWTHPTRGPIPPEEFIRMAEEIHQIDKLGALFFQEACETYQGWRYQSRSPLGIGLNVSEFQLNTPEFVTLIESTLRSLKIDPASIELELTEQNFLNKDRFFIKLLEMIVNLGVKLVIDGFGTGPCSLACLTKIPISKIKVDQDLVRNAASSSPDQAIFRSILAMAHELNIDVIAKGIETFEQLNFLKSMGCDLVQGYLFSSPVSADRIDHFFSRGGILPPKDPTNVITFPCT